jgi:hypothetical protein
MAVKSINKQVAKKLEAAKMRFLRLLLGLTRLDCQRNPHIHNQLKVGNLLEYIKSYQKKWISTEANRNHKQKLAFQYQPRG